MSGETTTIPTEVHVELQADAATLAALRDAGVDNWEGYDVAMEALR
jgi:hypothetical protein